MDRPPDPVLVNEEPRASRLDPRKSIGENDVIVEGLQVEGLNEQEQGHFETVDKNGETNASDKRKEQERFLNNSIIHQSIETYEEELESSSSSSTSTICSDTDLNTVNSPGFIFGNPMAYGIQNFYFGGQEYYGFDYLSYPLPSIPSQPPMLPQQQTNQQQLSVGTLYSTQGMYNQATGLQTYSSGGSTTYSTNSFIQQQQQQQNIQENMSIYSMQNSISSQAVISNLLEELKGMNEKAGAVIKEFLEFCNVLEIVGSSLENTGKTVKIIAEKLNICDFDKIEVKNNRNIVVGNNEVNWEKLEAILRRRYTERPITADVVYNHVFPGGYDFTRWNNKDMTVLLYIIFDQNHEPISSNENDNYIYTQNSISPRLSVQQERNLRDVVKYRGERIGYDSWQLVTERMGWSKKDQIISFPTTISNTIKGTLLPNEKELGSYINNQSDLEYKLQILNITQKEIKDRWQRIELIGIRALLTVLNSTYSGNYFGVIIGDTLIKGEESKDKDLTAYFSTINGNASNLKGERNMNEKRKDKINILNMIKNSPITKQYLYIPESKLGWDISNPQGIITSLLTRYQDYDSYSIRARASVIAASTTCGELCSMFDIDIFLTSQLTSENPVWTNKVSNNNNNNFGGMMENKHFDEERTSNYPYGSSMNEVSNSTFSGSSISKCPTNKVQTDLVLWRLIFGCRGNGLTKSLNMFENMLMKEGNFEKQMPPKKPPSFPGENNLIVSFPPPSILFIIHVVRSIQITKLFVEDLDIISLYNDEAQLTKIVKEKLNTNICGYYQILLLQSLTEGINGAGMYGWRWGDEDIIKCLEDKNTVRMWRATLKDPELKYDLSECVIRLNQCHLLPPFPR